MTEKRYKQVLGGIKDTESNRLLETPTGLMLQYADVFNNCIEWLNEQEEEINTLQLIIEVNGKAYQRYVKEYEEFIEELEKENEQLKRFKNIAKDYNLTLDQLYEIITDTLENGDM
ncbi:MAG: hypothetical protein IJP99_10710 [Methanobrevibacter sp.]|nr:hypothetical protein [Methanobrevibacter sp.]MBR0059789.1 hypothetical protein [Methanobrevibacter sp.]